MDPTHLVTPPRAHPSGTANGVDEHQRIVHVPWFIGLSVTVLLLLCFVAVVALIFFRRRHQITKEIGHLNGNFIKYAYQIRDFFFSSPFYRGVQFLFCFNHLARRERESV